VTVVRLSKEIATEYHICLRPYRAESGTSDMFDGVRLRQFIIEIDLYITSVLIHIF
jgi:hypothetical protein